ncbi:MAG: CHAD domain-containing protein [Nocardiopsaceae bacterium]|jgi:CHAD domain-containing protein|nr:CHAD domain-containing protein [Nocardiopsaceae bacterium]
MVHAFSQELVLDGSTRPDPGDLLSALPPPLTWAPAARPRTVGRAWLDTFDWRLYRAGLTLELRTAAGRAELMLTCPDGARITAPAGRGRWPRLAGSLPPGELRERLGPVAGHRALIQVARGASTVREVRVLNDDHKTVAWLAIDQISVNQPEQADVPARLAVRAVRGYQTEAEQAVAALTGATTRRAPPVLAAVLAPAGQRPGCYSSKVDVRLTAGMPATTAVATVLLRLLDTFDANLDGTIRATDTEFLHDLRVSVRRTRSALKLAGDMLPPGLADRFQPEFKWLGDLTTPTRDMDVYLLGFDTMSAGLVAAAPEELLPFRGYLTRRRAAARRRLLRGLRSERLAALRQEWRAALTALTSSPRAGRARGAAAAAPAIGEFAAARIARAHRKVLKRGEAITPESPPERLHDLRKRCKELRYLLEFFASLHEPAPHQRVLRQLKGLQDCLGDLQDTQIQQHEIREAAAQMMKQPDTPATALLAMGEVAAGVAARERAARADFASRFADFAAAGTQRRVRALTGAAA